MNIVDLIVCIVALWAVLSGWRKGLIVQVCSLLGLVAAVWLAFRFGAAAGEMLGLDEKVASIAGFALVLILGMILFSLAGRAMRGLFRFAGVGALDVLLGIALSVLKFGIILSLLVSAFDSLNRDWKMADEATLESSYTYKPLLRLSDSIFPFVEQLSKSVPENELTR